METGSHDTLSNASSIAEQAARYRAYFVNSPLAVMVVDAAGRYIEVNPAATQMTGYEESELLTMSLADVVAEECRADGITHFARVQEVGHASGEFVLIHKSGARRWITCHAVKLADDRFIAFKTDITDRKRTEEALRQSEEGLRLVLQAANVGWWSLDLASDEMQADDRCKAMFGMPPDSPASLAVAYEATPPDYRSFVEQSVAEARLHPGDYEVEYPIVWPDGSRHWVFSKGRSYHDAAGPIMKGIVIDVTARKIAEEALRASEENFRQFFNSIDECLLVVNSEGRILHINDTVTTKLGYVEEELAGQSVACLHPEDRREEAARTAADMCAGKTSFCPIPIVAKDGRLIPVETRVVRGKWNGQEVMFGISKDLSELRASEERFSKAFHGNPSPMAIASLARGCMLDVNEAFLRVMGYQREEIVGQVATQLRLFADRSQREAALAILNECGMLSGFEADILTKHGQLRRGLLSAEFIQLQDERVLLTVMHDITDRKLMEDMLRESEERYRLLVETVPLMAWRSRADGSGTDCNQRWCDYTGQTPDAMRDYGWLDAVHPDDLPLVQQRVANAANRQGPFELEYRLRRAADNSYRWHLCRGAPLKDKDGRVTDWFGCVTDVEDLKQAQQVLRNANAEQLERHRAELAHVARLSIMGEMAAGLAHELNQPLHAINNYAAGSLLRVCEMPRPDEELIAALQKVSEEAGRAAAIVRRVRRFVQKQEPHFAEFALNDAVADVVLLNTGEIEQRNVHIVRELASDLPPAVGDRVQIEQVIMNLVRNALEALEDVPTEQRVLRIKTFQRDDGTLQLDACDAGQGIDRQNLDSVFEPFFTTKPEGMGMGLSISRRILQAHGGRLWVTPNEAHGCTFHFTVPAGKQR